MTSSLQLFEGLPLARLLSTSLQSVTYDVHQLFSMPALWPVDFHSQVLITSMISQTWLCFWTTHLSCGLPRTHQSLICSIYFRQLPDAVLKLWFVSTPLTYKSLLAGYIDWIAHVSGKEVKLCVKLCAHVNFLSCCVCLFISGSIPVSAGLIFCPRYLHLCTSSITLPSTITCLWSTCLLRSTLSYSCWFLPFCLLAAKRRWSQQEIFSTIKRM